MYEFGNAIIDLPEVVAIQRIDIDSVIIAVGSAVLVLSCYPEECDDTDLTYDERCDLGYNKLVTAWKESKGL